jgi:hypothetical protein
MHILQSVGKLWQQGQWEDIAHMLSACDILCVNESVKTHPVSICMLCLYVHACIDIYTRTYASLDCVPLSNFCVI